MVAVEYPDLSGEAENAENPNQLSGVPRGARPLAHGPPASQPIEYKYGTCRSTWTPTTYTGSRTRTG